MDDVKKCLILVQYKGDFFAKQSKNREYTKLFYR